MFKDIFDSLFDFRKIIRFGLVGLLSGAVYAIIFLLLKHKLEIPVFWASSLSFLISIPISYFGNRWLTYGSNNKIKTEALRFFGVQVINLLCTSSIIYILSIYFNLSTFWEIVTAYLVAPMLSFVLYEIWVYRQVTFK